MEQVVIYSSGCPSCSDAEQIMRELGAQPEVVDVKSNDRLRAEVGAFLEAHGIEVSFPQVVVGTMFVGGLDRIKELKASGRLEQLLTTPQKKKGPCCRGLPEDQCNDMHRGMGKKGAEEAHSHDHEKEHVH